MNAGKSMDLLKIAYNYEEQGKKVMLFTPSIDTRYGAGKITSRAGLQRDAIVFKEGTDIFSIVKEIMPHCVLLDEVNFLKKSQVYELTRIVDELDIPVIGYGLKNDFRNELFEGSMYMLIYADKIEEVKTVCFYCNRKATMVIRFKDGVPVYEGEQIQIGGNSTYKPVCRKHYKNPII
jgi:thymidine kinase